VHCSDSNRVLRRASERAAHPAQGWAAVSSVRACPRASPERIDRRFVMRASKTWAAARSVA